MPQRIHASAILAAILLSAASAQPVFAQSAIRWTHDIDRARQQAAETNRLVLVHFWSRSCAPCMQLERTVFADVAFARGLESDFVPVKINADDFAITTQRYGITRLPTDVVITPSGELVCKTLCPATASEYTAQLRQIVVDHGAARARAEEQIAERMRKSQFAGPPLASSPLASSPVAAAGSNVATTSASTTMRPQAQEGPDPRLPYGKVNVAIPSQPVASQGLASQPGPAHVPLAVPPGLTIAKPPLPTPSPNSLPGLDGFCPVRLVTQHRWQSGDPRYGAVHRGRVYLFAGPEEQRAFLTNPDYYSPVLAGCDAVYYSDRNQLVPGARQYGVFFRNRIFLFADESSAGAFRTDPAHYAARAEEATRTAATALR
jgi:protein disulfide-isomerase